MSLVGVVTTVTSEITGAVVSVVVVEVVEEPPSLLLLQEMTVRLKMDMRIMYKTFFHQGRSISLDHVFSHPCVPLHTFPHGGK